MAGSEDVSQAPAKVRLSGPWWTLTAVLLIDVSGMLPVMLVGSLAPDLIGQMGLSTTSIAVIVASFFVCGSITALTLGSRLDRFGVKRVCVIGAAVSIVVLVGIGLFARSTIVFVIALAIAGGALALTMPASNAVIVHASPVKKRALAISIKQSGVALALLVSGLLLPFVSGQRPWQLAFYIVTLIGVLGLILLARQNIVVPPRNLGSSITQVRRSVIWIGVSVMLASILPGALTGFASLTLVTTGVSVSVIAMLFALGNILGIGVRIISGWAADRLLINVGMSVGALMIFGGIGAVLISTPNKILASVGVVVAFALGWGWTGLTYFLVVMNRESDAGSVSAIAQSGGMAGTATGPLVMGLSISLLGLHGAWIVVAAIGVVTGMFVVWMTHKTQRDAQGIAHESN